MKLNKVHRRNRKRRVGGPSRGLKAGLPPGTAVFVGERKQDEVHIGILRYSAGRVEEVQDCSLKDCGGPATEGVTWININGIHDVATVVTLAKQFGLHPLTVEDIVNTGQRPKAEEFDDYIFIVLKMLSYDEKKEAIDIENVSLVLGANFVLSFQERKGDLFDSLRDRIRQGKGKVRGAGADYLAYSLMDAVLDGYFSAIEKLGEGIEALDDAILNRPVPDHMNQLHHFKREVLFVRKSVWPLREMISTLEKSLSPLLGGAIRTFLRDLYDHSLLVIDMVDTYRDLIAGMHDTYLTSVSNGMNEVMKMLTLIATIFIPLTFIAGVYGMNFAYMPELEWRYGYFLVMGAMALVGLGLLAFFRKRKWL